MPMTDYDAHRDLECIGCRSVSWPCECEEERRFAEGHERCMACGQVPCLGQVCVESHAFSSRLIVSMSKPKTRWDIILE